MTLSLLHFLNTDIATGHSIANLFSCKKATIVIIFLEARTKKEKNAKGETKKCVSGRVQARYNKCNNKGVKKIMNLVRVIITVVIGFNYTFYNHNERFKQQSLSCLHQKEKKS